MRVTHPKVVSHLKLKRLVSAPIVIGASAVLMLLIILSYPIENRRRSCFCRRPYR